MKQQVNIRLSDATVEKLNFLAEKYGTATTAVEVAIGKLYESEASMLDKQFKDIIVFQKLQETGSLKEIEAFSNLMRAAHAQGKTAIEHINESPRRKMHKRIQELCAEQA